MLTRKKYTNGAGATDKSLIDPGCYICPTDEILLACRKKERQRPKNLICNQERDELLFERRFDEEKKQPAVAFIDTMSLFHETEYSNLSLDSTPSSRSMIENSPAVSQPIGNSSQRKRKSLPRKHKKVRKKPTLIASAQKKPWSDEEDRILAEAIETYGAQSWSRIAKCLPGRIGKQCRERWHNHLCPTVKKGNWTQEEDEIIFQQHKLVGNQWALIAKNVKGRTDNAVKNRYYSTMRKLNRQTAKSKRQKPAPLLPQCELTIDTSISESMLELPPFGCYQFPGYPNWIPKSESSPTGLSLPSDFQPVSSNHSGHSLFCQD